MAAELPLLPGFMQRMIQRWASRRQPAAQAEITVHRRQLYILPTRQGLLFFGILLLILIGAINYEISLGYMLTFLLGSLGLLAMVYTHQNLNGLQVSVHRAEPVFAGQDAQFAISISQRGDALHPALHPALQLRSDNSPKTTQLDLIREHSVNGTLALPTTQRGYISPGMVKLFSEYPLGLFHAWSWLKLDAQCLVYPAPAAQHFKLRAGQQVNNKNPRDNQLSSDKRGTDDFSGIRPYQLGDQRNHMAWKAIARTGQLQTLQFSQDASEDIWLSWDQLDPHLDIERKLSSLCRMVLDADQQGLRYGLQLPDSCIEPNTGLQHKQHCLEQLALFAR